MLLLRGDMAKVVATGARYLFFTSLHAGGVT
jgi:hypothetical protein